MKRALGLLLAMVMCMGIMSSAIAASESEADAVIYNDAFNKDEMLSVKGEKVKLSGANGLVGDQVTGFAFVIPEQLWNELMKMDSSMAYMSDIFYIMDYIPEAYMSKLGQLDEAATDAEKSTLMDELNRNSVKVLRVYRVNQKIKESLQLEKEGKEMFEHLQHMGTIGDDQYYIAYNDNFDKTQLSENDKANLNKIVQGIESVQNSLMLFPAKNNDSSGKPLDADLQSFTAKDLDGNEFSQDMFAKYDLTMVNVWATWCGPCTMELPGIAELYNKLPDNVNIISICTDGTEDSDLAHEILDQAKAKFTTLVPNDEMNKSLLNKIDAFPTTFFVNSQGKVVGGTQVGAPGEPEDIVDAYQKLIEENLKALGK